MRWYALDVDFEMYGKDLIESAILSTKIIKLLGKNNPSGFAYELFLDEKGEKISKSKGNGITIDEWLEYASPESLSLFMYQNPKRAKKLYREIVPKSVDEYLDYIDKGKVRFIFQDFPLGAPALAASMISRCAGPDRYFGFIEIFFRSQENWSRSKNPLQELINIARIGGLSGEDVKACLKQQPLLEYIRRGALVGQEDFEINSTPSFVIGNEVIRGAQTYEVFKKTIDKALKNKP